MLFPLPNGTDAAKPARVAVTGAGIVTALGVGWQKNAEGFRAGRTAFRPVSLFDVSRQRCKIAAEVDLPGELPATCLSRKNLQRLDRASRMLLLAAAEAWSQARWSATDDMPVVLGTTGGEMNLGQQFLRQAIQFPDDRRRQPTRITHYQAQRQGLDLCGAFGFQGPVTIIANACASSANAIGHAWELVRRRRAETVITGGYESLSEMTLGGFDSLQALSPAPCRPFAADRDGLTLGEGAAIFALESLDRALRRDAEILGEIIGYGAVTDTYHLTQPHPGGDAALGAMSAACARAGVSPAQIDYLNAHGTATPHNDAAEAAAINLWAGPRAPDLPVSSTKAGIGHLLGAAGAVEAAVCLMALRGQWLPPQTSSGPLDPACRFHLVREPADASLNIALSNSFGFGGANATLILRRWA
ncbi:MAG: beta-ketoacyl-[acyl-carrier-protein] synthase family protein [Verrucomicrobiota bacterium]|jgi:3-oxoacyl-[acyl-carrier-protein] synthase II